jgi:DNA (cytosine-5)-methyltransferase 1
MNPNQPLNELALFAGAGGGILGGKLLGWRTVCAVEWDAYARDVLVARQNDGCLDPFPIWDDVQTFDGTPWRGSVDVVSGGFPCQDISAAGKGAGIEGERSGMWKHMARIIGEVLPRFVLVENSPLLVGRGLGVVIADLAQMGYDATWGIVGAHHAAAPHKRDRIWIVANASGVHDRSGNAGTSQRQESEPRKSRGASHVANALGGRGQLSTERELSAVEQPRRDSEARSSGGIAGEWWATEPDVGGKTDGMATKLDGGKAHD